MWGTKYSPEDIPGIENPAEKIQGGVPNLDWNNMTAWYGGGEGGHIGFSPVAPLTGPDALAVRDLLRGMVHGAGLDYIAGLLPVNARSFVHITMVIFDTKDEAQTRAAYDVSRRLVVEAAKLGYGEYRAHLDFMDLAQEQYSFGDHAYRRFCETIKDALDPNGILSPGKQGIWPRSMRQPLGRLAPQDLQEPLSLAVRSGVSHRSLVIRSVLRPCLRFSASRSRSSSNASRSLWKSQPSASTMSLASGK